MQYFLSLVIVGIIVGCIYALVAIGFVLIYKASKILNFAQGELLLIGAFVAYTFLSIIGLPPLVSVFMTLLFSAFLGFIIERIALRPMVGEPEISIIMITLGLAVLLRGLCRSIWGSDNIPFPKIVPEVPEVSVEELFIPSVYFWVIFIVVVFIILLSLFFKYSKFGISMRASADDQLAALSLGISYNKVFIAGWAMSAVVAAVAGILLGNLNVISIQMAFIGLKVFPVIILGGLDSIGGVICAGLIIGILESFASGYLDGLLTLSTSVKEVVSYICLIIIIWVKPYGLFGVEEIERV